MKPRPFQFRINFDEYGRMSEEDQSRYNDLVYQVRKTNRINRFARIDPVDKLTVRKRYFGPRKFDRWRSPHQKQSMCLKENAKGCRVYIYSERAKAKY